MISWGTSDGSAVRLPSIVDVMSLDWSEAGGARWTGGVRREVLNPKKSLRN